MNREYPRAKIKTPNFFQGILWSKNIKNLDLEKDKVYIIHQILSYGNMEQIKRLFEIYKLKEIQEVFIRYPKKIYLPSVFYFVKNFILDLKNKRLSPKNYVKTTFRALR